MNVEVYFNEEIKQQVIAEISKANKEIVAAIAWFNDKEIYNVLNSKAQEGISVNLIISNDLNNFNSPDSLDFELLINSGAKVNRLITSEKLMHHKFCIVDNHTIMTGSYNWTYGGSTSNLENMVLIENDIKNCEKYKAEYDRMLKTYFKHIDEAIETLERMKSAISDLQAEVIKNRYLPDKILENLRKYGSGNFLIESPNTNPSLVKSNITISEISKSGWWESLPQSVKELLNDKFLKIGRLDTKPVDDAMEYLLKIEEIDASNYNQRFWNSAKNRQETSYFFKSCAGLEKLPNLKSLDISYNYLSTSIIEGIGELLGLEKLDISNNEIGTLPLVDFLPNLTELNISNNSFSSIDFMSNLPNLKILRCDGNKLSGVEGIEKAKNLRFLFLNRDTFELPFVKSRLTELGFMEKDYEAESIVKLENELLQ